MTMCFSFFFRFFSTSNLFYCDSFEKFQRNVSWIAVIIYSTFSNSNRQFKRCKFSDLNPCQAHPLKGRRSICISVAHVSNDKSSHYFHSASTQLSAFNRWIATWENHRPFSTVSPFKKPTITINAIIGLWSSCTNHLSMKLTEECICHFWDQIETCCRRTHICGIDTHRMRIIG